MDTIRPALVNLAPGRFSRWRKPVSRIAAAAFLSLLLFSTSEASPAVVLLIEVAGIILLTVSVFGRVWCSVYIAGRKNRELCEDGPYSLCRNPLYVFSFLGVVGLALAARMGTFVLLFAVPFWIYHHFVIRSEEQRLALLFGDDYKRYCAVVPRLFPRFRNYWSRASLTTDPRIIGRSLLETAWFLAVLVVIEIVEHLRIHPAAEGMPTAVSWPF